MRQRTDLWGNPVTARSEEAVDAYNQTILSYLGMRVDIGDNLKATFEADPGMPMALLTKGAFLMMFSTSEMQAGAARAVEKARAIVAQAHPREQAHLAALSVWVDGDMAQACRLWEGILVDYPRDVMALKLSQLNRFYLGIGKDMRDALARAWYAWDEAVPGYGFIAGSYAFALEEAGDYARAEPLGRRAIELQPEDVWAAHAVAHVLEMQGRCADGLAWLDGLKDNWSAVHNFVHHAHWHRALFALDGGDADLALSIFDQDIWTEKVEDYLDLSNGAALLWRLQECGLSVGRRWENVAALATGKTSDEGLVFSDCHIALALSQAGQKDPETLTDAADFVSKLDKMPNIQDTQSRLRSEVGRHLCAAAHADAAGESAEVVRLLTLVRPELYRIGGSHAQRDLFERMLIANALKSGEISLVRALLSERCENRPGDKWARLRRAELISE